MHACERSNTLLRPTPTTTCCCCGIHILPGNPTAQPCSTPPRKEREACAPSCKGCSQRSVRYGLARSAPSRESRGTPLVSQQHTRAGCRQATARPAPSALAKRVDIPTPPAPTASLFCCGTRTIRGGAPVRGTKQISSAFMVIILGDDPPTPQPTRHSPNPPAHNQYTPPETQTDQGRASDPSHAHTQPSQKLPANQPTTNHQPPQPPAPAALHSEATAKNRLRPATVSWQVRSPPARSSTARVRIHTRICCSKQKAPPFCLLVYLGATAWPDARVLTSAMRAAAVRSSSRLF